MSLIRITADTSAIESKVEELRLLIEGLDYVPDEFVSQIMALSTSLCDEIIHLDTVPTTAPGVSIVRMGIRTDGRLEALICAARILSGDVGVRH